MSKSKDISIGIFSIRNTSIVEFNRVISENKLSLKDRSIFMKEWKAYKKKQNDKASAKESQR